MKSFLLVLTGVVLGFLLLWYFFTRRTYDCEPIIIPFEKELPMQSVRIIEIPDCKMVSSGVGFFGEEKFEGLLKWFSAKPRTLYPMDFLSASFDEKGEFNGMIWYYVYDGVNAPEGYDIVDFKGGLYAVSTDIDQRTDIGAMDAEVDAFLEAHNLERDHSRPRLGHIISSPSAQKVLNYAQMDYFAPVKPR